MIAHGKINEIYVAETLQNKIYSDKFIYLKASFNEVIYNKMFCSGFT